MYHNTLFCLALSIWLYDHETEQKVVIGYSYCYFSRKGISY